MKCQTVLAGTECTFWGKQGCIFPGGSCQTIAENCEGCERVVVGSAYPAPAKKWIGGICNFASHVKVDLSIAELKINPLKASKKAAGAKKKK